MPRTFKLGAGQITILIVVGLCHSRGGSQPLERTRHDASADAWSDPCSRSRCPDECPADLQSPTRPNEATSADQHHRANKHASANHYADDSPDRDTRAHRRSAA
jgi:hypothetical protein